MNVKAAQVLQDPFGFIPPDFLWSAHAVSGSIKCLVMSKTMNVPVVTTLYKCQRIIIKHFESSLKNKEPIHQCMEILKMTTLHVNVNIITYSGVMTIFFYKGLNRNLEIGNTLV